MIVLYNTNDLASKLIPGAEPDLLMYRIIRCFEPKHLTQAFVDHDLVLFRIPRLIAGRYHPGIFG